MKLNTYTSKKVNRSRGFSLIELLVSVFIFSIVMTISMGSLIVLIDANEKGQGIQTVMTNLSFALDSMTRDMRTGYDYYCESVVGPPENLPQDDDSTPDVNEATNDCEQGNFVAFVDNRTGERTGFWHNAPSNDAEGIGSIQRKIEDGDWLDVTAPELSVTEFHVTVNGSIQGDEIQPTAQFFVEGYIVNESDDDPDFHLQTHITQRTLDF